MAEIIRGMKNWLAYSTMSDDEWRCLRETHVEQEIRRLFCNMNEDLDCSSEDDCRELGGIEIPTRAGAFKQLKRLPGRAFISRNPGESGDQYKLQIMVSAAFRGEGEVKMWEPVCSWAFDSVEDIRDFVGLAHVESVS
jgi:hypothetical protein